MIVVPSSNAPILVLLPNLVTSLLRALVPAYSRLRVSPLSAQRRRKAFSWSLSGRVKSSVDGDCDITPNVNDNDNNNDHDNDNNNDDDADDVDDDDDKAT